MKNKKRLFLPLALSAVICIGIAAGLLLSQGEKLTDGRESQDGYQAGESNQAEALAEKNSLGEGGIVTISNKNSGDLISGEAGTAANLTELAVKWAEAFSGRDGDTLWQLCENPESFTDMGGLEKTPEGVSFGFSSPWPFGGKQYEINISDPVITVYYYAVTSDPTVRIWKENLQTKVVEGTYLVTESTIKEFEEVSSKADFEEAYRRDGGYVFYDYAEEGWPDVPEENQGARIGDSPEIAVVEMLRLSNGTAELLNQKGNKAVVRYHWEGESVDIPLYSIVNGAGREYWMPESVR